MIYSEFLKVSPKSVVKLILGKILRKKLKFSQTNSEFFPKKLQNSLGFLDNNKNIPKFKAKVMYPNIFD